MSNESITVHNPELAKDLEQFLSRSGNSSAGVTLQPPANVPAPAVQVPLTPQQPPVPPAPAVTVEAPALRPGDLESLRARLNTMDATLQNLLETAAGLKDPMAKVGSVTYVEAPEMMDLASNADLEWLHAILAPMSAALMALTNGHNAQAGALGSYAGQVESARDALIKRRDLTLQEVLDALYSPLWRELFAEGSRQAIAFDAWMNGLPHAEAKKHDHAYRTCQYAEDIVPTLDAFVKANPGIFASTPVPSASAPGGMEASVVPANAGATPVQTTDGLKPLTREEFDVYPQLLAKTTDPKERAILTQRYELFAQEAFRRR